MNDYGVSDYSVFDDAISVINSFVDNANSVSDIINECRSELNDGVFMGPIADNCQEVFGTLAVDFGDLISNLSTMSEYLEQANSNYQAGDRNASSTITGGEKTASTSNASTTNTTLENNISSTNTYSGGVTSTTTSNSSSSGEKSAIFVGDSRTVGMQAAIGNAGDVWSGKVGQGLNWMKSTGIPNVEEQITEGANVVIMMGVNDCGYNASAYVDYLNDLSAKAEDKGANLYFVSVNPTSGSYSNLNTSIDNFNATIKEGINSNIKYIDTNSVLKENGFNSGDGLHYDSSTYQTIYGIIKDNM